MAEALNRWNGSAWVPVSEVNRIVVETIVETPEGKDYRVRFIDYEGTVLKTVYCGTGESAIPPSAPVHDGLTFLGWNHTATELSSVTHELDVGAMFITTDEKTHLHITLNVITGLSPTLYFYQPSGSVVSIDWGDGNTATVSTGGYVNYSHTYSTAGNYVIKLWIVSGSVYVSLGNGSSPIIGGSTYTKSLTEANIGSTAVINNKSFYGCASLVAVSIPRFTRGGDNSIPNSVFESCYSLKSIVVPDDMYLIGSNAFKACYSLQTVSLPRNINLFIYDQVFHSCSALKSIVLPDNTYNLGNYVFCNCYSLEKIYLPDGLYNIGMYAFYYCYSLLEITLPSNFTRATSYMLRCCSALKSVVIPSAATKLDPYCLADCVALQSVTISSGITAIGTYALSNTLTLKEIILQRTTPPTLENVNALENISPLCRIKVPAASLSAYKSASNWSTYKNYMEGY